jgi:hypothetical protein
MRSCTTSRPHGRARLPHAWVYDPDGGKHSTLDLVGRGQFTLLTGINGEPWVEAAEKVAKAIGIELSAPMSSVHAAIIDRPSWRLGACPRGQRGRLRSGAPRPACRLAQPKTSL